MPRAESTTHRSNSSDPLTPGPHPNVLKRNQACHQCRRRKLKCDAKRPCSTCVRSHTHAVNHAPPGANLPSAPECTFDDAAEASTTIAESPKNRYERLENRINELEALLRQKDAEATTLGNSPAQSTYPRDNDNAIASSSSNHSASVPSTPLDTAQPLHLTSMYQRGQDGVIPNSMTAPQLPQLQQPHQLSQGAYPSTEPSLQPPLGNSSYQHRLDVVWPNWPPNIPGPDLLRHLVEVFFVFHPHANRLFHTPTFMSSLALPPSHPKFPSTPVLHAICAIGSLYTAAVTGPPPPDLSEMEPDEIFSQRYRIKEQRPDSFAEQQAKLAKETAEHLNVLGENLFQVVQANIILSWFYWSHSKWVEVFLASANSIRVTVPLGLNMCPPFHSIAKSVRPASILPPAKNVIEDEMRRNAFWLAYATERQHGCGNGWALSLDDQDVSQLLPLRGDQFEQGVLVPPGERQWAHTRDLLLTHPESQTDSFILYMKGTILISRVKSFNLRFRARHFAGDAAVATPYNELQTQLEPIDPRGSPAFIELDYIVSSFRSSFPSHLRNPIVNNVVDNHLYTTCLVPHVLTIVLHDPHADVQQSGCISALKILTAARAILDLIYNVWSTSYDITLLDSFCSFCWFVAGRVLVRFLSAAIDANSQDQISTLRAELDFVQSAIAKVGQRIPLAFRFAKLLENLILKRCGPSPGPTAQITFPRPTDSSVLHALYEETVTRSNRNTSLYGNLLNAPGSFVSLA